LLKKNTGIYFDFVETGNTRDGWYLWCSICINLNAVFKKCLVISYCPTVSSCVYVYIYVLINFWLCYVIKFTWMIQQRWKTFDATVRIGFCPFLTLKNKFQALNWFFDISNGQTAFNQLIQIYEATEWERERKLVVCLFVWSFGS